MEYVFHIYVGLQETTKSWSQTKEKMGVEPFHRIVETKHQDCDLRKTNKVDSTANMRVSSNTSWSTCGIEGLVCFTRAKWHKTNLHEKNNCSKTNNACLGNKTLQKQPELQQQAVGGNQKQQ